MNKDHNKKSTRPLLNQERDMNVRNFFPRKLARRLKALPHAIAARKVELAELASAKSI